MAIIIEKEKRGARTQMIVGIIVVFVLFFGIYYLFFVRPPLVDVIVPQGLKSISKISEVKISPSTVIDSPIYKSLKEYVKDVDIGEFGRENPFDRF